MAKASKKVKPRRADADVDVIERLARSFCPAELGRRDQAATERIAMLIARTIPAGQSVRIAQWAGEIWQVNRRHFPEQRFRFVGVDKSQRYLKDMALLAAQLWQSLNDRPADVTCALSKASDDGGEGPDDLLDGLQPMLQELILRIANASTEIAHAQVPSEGPRRIRAGEIAAVAAEAYIDLTGLPPSRHVDVSGTNQKAREKGPFVAFLQELYDLLRIDASAASQAKKLLEEIGEN